MKSKKMKQGIAVLTLVTVLSFIEVFAQCPFSSFLTSARTKLYLYFATASDPTFPEYDVDLQTSPLEPFNVSDLDSGIGTTDQLRNRIVDIVKEDYCEFDVEVVSTTTAPSPAESQWQIVGIGSDDEKSSLGSDVFGVAQEVDLNNSLPQDYARVYAKSFLNAYGGSGEALNGANSTLERWATAIGHTVGHEAGHNFGLAHSDSKARPGEDAQNNHIMATGSTGLTPEMRASGNRHFGDQEYEILGHNIGLRVKTLYNWDFVNPNAEDAHSLVLTFLTSASTLTLNWFYAGSTSPWTSPTVASAGTGSFQGTTYNRFTLTFSSAKAWSGGSSGVVPGGVEFHVGASFAESDLVIVSETGLKDSASSILGLHPRLAGFNKGTADLNTGDFTLRMFNSDPGHAVQIEAFQVFLLPRLASIDSMVTGEPLRDIRGVPIVARQPGNSFINPSSRELRGSVDFRLAAFNDPRFVDVFHDATNCKRGIKQGPLDVNFGEIEYCPSGWALSLFPSTYVYMIATVVDPDARHWDRVQGRYVTGPLRSKVFYQFGGILPDFNRNGVDDLVDIRTRTSKDDNHNGIVDEAEGQPLPPGFSVPTLSEWGAILMALLFIATSMFFTIGRAQTAFATAAATARPYSLSQVIDWKLLVRTGLCSEAAITLALAVVRAGAIDAIGSLASGLLIAVIIQLLITNARRSEGTQRRNFKGK